jgi:hypothetical protein
MLYGQVIGRHFDSGRKLALGRVIHVGRQHASEGPAENAFLYVEERHGAMPRARYISWINLYDIEFAATQNQGDWSLVQPPERFKTRVEWCPFGWDGKPLPNVAYVIPALSDAIS